MNYFQDALASTRSTILYGFYGRYPRVTKFYLDAIPELKSVSEFELIFSYGNNRLLYVLLEPPFDAVIPCDRWYLVLTSHVRLRYNPSTTRVVNANLPVTREIPMPEERPDQRNLIPPTCHEFAFYDQKPTRIDLSRVTNTHEAYLRLLTFLDVVVSKWSLCIKKKLRDALLKDLPTTGPYDLYLLTALSRW